MVITYKFFCTQSLLHPYLAEYFLKIFDKICWPQNLNTESCSWVNPSEHCRKTELKSQLISKSFSSNIRKAWVGSSCSSFFKWAVPLAVPYKISLMHAMFWFIPSCLQLLRPLQWLILKSASYIFL